MLVHQNTPLVAHCLPAGKFVRHINGGLNPTICGLFLFSSRIRTSDEYLRCLVAKRRHPQTDRPAVSQPVSQSPLAINSLIFHIQHRRVWSPPHPLQHCVQSCDQLALDLVRFRIRLLPVLRFAIEPSSFVAPVDWKSSRAQCPASQATSGQEALSGTWPSAVPLGLHVSVSFEPSWGRFRKRNEFFSDGGRQLAVCDSVNR